MITSKDFEGYDIPGYMQGGLIRYFNNGISPGSFMSAVLENNLVEAQGRADSTNAEIIPEYVRFLQNKVPATAWGSRANVDAHLDSFRVAA